MTSEGRDYEVSYFFLQKPVVAAPSTISCLTSSCRFHQIQRLTSCSQVVSYLLRPYGTEDVLTEADADIIIYKLPQDLKAVDYFQSLWIMVLRFGPVFNQYLLKRASEEGLQLSIQQHMRRFWAEHKRAPFEEPARHALSLTNVQLGSQSPENPKLERNCDHYEKGIFDVESNIGLEQPFVALQDFALGSKLLALSEGRTASTRRKTVLKSTALMESVKYCEVFLNCTHPTSRCQIIAIADKSI